MSAPPITILMACYNSEQFLEETFSCILNQTFSDFEVVVVDDGSTDNTPTLLSKYAKLDKRIRILRKEHSGLTDSLQQGLNVAQGEWIARWDADDLAEPNRLEEQYKYMQKQSKVVLVGSGCFEIDALGKVIKKHTYPTDHRRLVHNLERLRKFFPHSSAFFNRRAALAIGGYRKRFIYAQDRDLWLRLTTVGKIACLSAPLVYIRKHAHAISSRKSSFQTLLSVAATVCHLRRIQGLSDPSSMDTPIWREFLQWLEQRLSQEGLFFDEAMSKEIRTLYYGSMRGRVRALVKMIKRPQVLTRFLIRKYRGSDIAFRLAKEWPEGNRLSGELK